MAIHFHRDYSVKHNSRNFGDDINPYLLGLLFDKSIIESSQLCVVGIGTIISDRNAEAISHLKRLCCINATAIQGVRIASATMAPCIDSAMTRDADRTA